jgi:uncharacterized membrane protein YeaQ/YmgE (transglycosylase-associated protein family)
LTIEVPGLIAWILIGLVAGWLASLIMRRRGSVIGYALLGMIGALVGGVLFSLIGLGGAENIIGSIVVATVGAVLVLAVVGR